ncbi:MAG: ROK family protein [Clostridia bacterium]|nr:MAG: ROK family protein [Clostridia bacterium]
MANWNQAMEKREILWAGFDVGGTNIKAGLVNSSGEIVAWRSIATGRDKEPRAVFARLRRLSDEMLAAGQVPSGQLAGIGVGLPGTIRQQDMLLRRAPNLGWRDLDLAPHLQQLGVMPVYVDNDAHVAALGEAVSGAAQGYASFLLITVGTGLGSAFIYRGEVYRGAGGLGIELGHTCVAADGPRCTCGNRGCLEVFASASALVDWYREQLAAGGEIPSPGRPRPGAADIFMAAGQGDHLAQEAVNRLISYLALGLANAAVLLGPEAVVVGGGVGQAGDILFRPLQEQLDERLARMGYSPVPVLPAKLGNRAGVVGAAWGAARTNL